MERRGRRQPYNHQPLASCAATYIGQATPKASIKYPDIIYEPLKALYSKCRQKRQDLLAATSSTVRLRVYSSGIIVQEPGVPKDAVNWYPIQNLYCSAGLKPDKAKAETVIFRELHEKVKLQAKPYFAMVVRQPGDDGRRVLMCHAFIVDNTTVAQKLVNATQFAYQNKDGWNDPVTDKEFLNAKLSYTLQRLHEEDDNLDELKIRTRERDQQLAQRPDLSAKPRQPHVIKTSQSQRQHSVKSAATVKIQSAPATPRRVPSRAGSAMGSMKVVMTPRWEQPAPDRVPTHRAVSYYRGFNTETMDGQNGVVKSATIDGFPLTRTPSDATRTSLFQPMADPKVTVNGFKPTHLPKSRRNPGPSGSPRGHRVLASSVPQEASPSYSNGEHLEVIDWDSTVGHDQMNGDSQLITDKKNKSSKHHRPSKKLMEKYNSRANGDINGDSEEAEHTKVRHGGHDT